MAQGQFVVLEGSHDSLMQLPPSCYSNKFALTLAFLKTSGKCLIVCETRCHSCPHEAFKSSIHFRTLMRWAFVLTLCSRRFLSTLGVSFLVSSSMVASASTGSSASSITIGCICWLAQFWKIGAKEAISSAAKTQKLSWECQMWKLYCECQNRKKVLGFCRVGSG